ncbi:hypothetical protein PSTG_12467 [Puccinia striiformis f. sp. tritici PST-78]|uniref:Uncharacterized protein n=1 Tax=Puccinia striiformis f. sp. tritici PST-78 TaxID=1165861 RepID=A0A0L0V572_9BASI|nr:hypothetical protein PSTG_12467 [Puccinia striiformis f. sp. tritici PST-78]
MCFKKKKIDDLVLHQLNSSLSNKKSASCFLPGFCWNHIPSPTSLKRKSFNHTDLDLQVSKRHACQPADDISESSNFIDRRSNSDSAQISKFPLDIQSSRSNNDNRVLQQDKDLNRSHLNKTNELSLLERITLPPEDNSQIV